MTETFEELRNRYVDFVENERFDLETRINTAIDDAVPLKKCPRVTVTMAELRAADGNGGGTMGGGGHKNNGRLAQQLRLDPLRHLRALEAACHDKARGSRVGYDKGGRTIKVALAGPIGAAAASPRQLTSSCMRQLVCVEGVATKVSTIKPKVVQSVHYCPETKQHSERKYYDATDTQLGLPALDEHGRELPDRVINITSSVYPTKDADGRLLEIDFGLCSFKDHQTITLQEMPEKAPMGQLPRSVELILDHDLVDRIKPGDRVMVVGVYRALAPATQGQSMTSGVYRTVVLVNNVQILGRGTTQLRFDRHDVRTIKSLAARPDILSILGRSISPSIHGHTVIKKALALQLLSGVEKNLENGTHLRGDINILMVGDPSTAKSQLLRAAMTIAPLAVSTTGKGSSGVGLTAAVTSDPDTKERRLEAGAMVLADRGLVCVDEFDKMGENDRVAIHEAMEQQTVTIAKAGIHASLNARCSVLAAANPVYGQYDRRRRMQENIGLPDSLLSRFDLLFVVLDQMDPETDRKIAAHVVQGHRYRSEPGQAGYDSDGEDSDDDLDDEQAGALRVQTVWQRGRPQSDTDNNNNNEAGSSDPEDVHSNDHLQLDFLRKYLHYAKERIKPVLTEPARDFIANRYAEMRARQDERTLPITARSLETVIRLATAHAKARLSHVVEAEPDCEVAMDILSFALYHENNHGVAGSVTKVLDEGPPPPLNDNHGDDDENNGDTDNSRPKRPLTMSSDDDLMEGGSAKKKTLSQEGLLKDKLMKAIRENDGQLGLAGLDEYGGGELEAVRSAVAALVRENRVMLDQDDDMVYIV